MTNEQAIGPGGSADLAQPNAAANRDAKGPRHLFGPTADFLCLGGASLLFLPIVLFLPEREFTPAFRAVFLTLAYVINYPHFAFSYQIFYEGFRKKISPRESDGGLRVRYLVAGIVVPAALVVFFVFCLATGNAQLLGYGANLMGFLVGWHYVKQGYGMLMVDAALKRRFFDAAEKKILLANCYAVWALAWMLVNWLYGERGLWGIRYAMFDIPELAIAAGFCAAATTSVMTIAMLVKKWRAGDGLPMTGVVAYLVSLYLWLLVMHWNMLWLLMVPTLHSLQYLAVVGRYHINRYRDEANADELVRPVPLVRQFIRRWQQRLAGFVALGLLLGYVGFHGAPELLGPVIPYDRAVFSGTALLFVFWIFINVHHYFLDNVMWRHENPDVRKYLFAVRK